MERLFNGYLSDWRGRPDRKPLVLRGARQTGKTWLVNDFGAGFPGGCVHVNFERDPDLAAAFGPNDPAQIVGLLEARLRRTVTPGKSLLFLDEIQAAPDLLAKLRWFAEEMPEQHVIAAGSLLDFALGEHDFSMPVGRITYGHLEPMTFAEFLMACGEDRLVDAVRAATTRAGVHAALHDRLLELVRIHALVGGMPAAVASWVEHRSLSRVAEIHRDLLQTIRDDFAKYRRGVNAQRIAKVFAALPRLVGRKFQPSAVDRDEKSLALRDAFRLLAMARVVTIVERTAATGIPLGADIDPTYQKVCLLDSGLYASLCGLDVAALTGVTDLTLVNAGQLAEQWVGQELRAARPFNQEPALHTWARVAKNSNAEVDYVVQIGQRVVPVEVKSGASGRLRSLHVFVREKNARLGVRVAPGPLQLDQVRTALPDGRQKSFRLLSVPFYLVSELPRLVSQMS